MGISGNRKRAPFPNSYWFALGLIVTGGVVLIPYQQELGWLLVASGVIWAVGIWLKNRKGKVTEIDDGMSREDRFLKKLIADVRAHMKSDRYYINKFAEHDLYRVLKLYLSEECQRYQEEAARGNIERLTMDPSGGHSVATESLLNELARIERERKLV